MVSMGAALKFRLLLAVIAGEIDLNDICGAVVNLFFLQAVKAITAAIIIRMLRIFVNYTSNLTIEIE
jgi:hypothetical protein